MVLFGAHLSFVKPRTVAITFMTSDFCSLVLQAVGGAIAETANDNATAQKGLDVMIAGLLLQAISISVFLTFMTFFGWRSRASGKTSTDDDKQARLNRPLFKIFLASLVVATVAVLVRSIFRVVELWGGFSGKLWNNEKDFLVLDGAMMALAVLLLSVLHPGIAFGADWSTANWSFKPARTSNEDQPEMLSQ
jgi:H+/gluconate symporter-like permease